jgi:hypothetical protein
MKYLITSIKEIEELITPPLEIDDLFNPFLFSKLEEQFRNCMKFYRYETYGEDFEKFPISYKEFNPKYDKFYGLNFKHLNDTIEAEELKVDLIQYLNRCEDYFIEDITDQLPNPSEAEFKMVFYNALKTLKDSYDFLLSTDILNNVILNLVKDELIESYKRALEKAKITFPVYNDIISLNVFGNKNLNESNVTTENNATINLNENPFPRIFLDNDSFMFFEEYKNKFCTNNKFPLADFSFVFRMMQKEGNIFDDVTEKSFRNFLTDNYGINFEKLKTYEYSVTEKKIQLYNSLKK